MWIDLFPVVSLCPDNVPVHRHLHHSGAFSGLFICAVSTHWSHGGTRMPSSIKFNIWLQKRLNKHNSCVWDGKIWEKDNFLPHSSWWICAFLSLQINKSSPHTHRKKSRMLIYRTYTTFLSLLFASRSRKICVLLQPSLKTSSSSSWTGRDKLTCHTATF